MKIRPQPTGTNWGWARTTVLIVIVFTFLAIGSPFLTDARKSSDRGGRALQARTVSADRVWQEVDPEAVRAVAGDRPAGPKTYRTLTLNKSALFEILSTAPLEFTSAAKTQEIRLSLPMADGTFQQFRIEESPIMESGLARRYPEIKTYGGQGIDDGTATTRFDWTPFGFHAFIISEKGTVLIEPYAAGDTSRYVVYAQKDATPSTFVCETDDSRLVPPRLERTPGEIRAEVSNGPTLRTYRLAVAATAEYTQQYGGGTVSGSLAAVTTTINGVNLVNGNELAIRLVLIANNDAIIFTDPLTDGYTSDNTALLVGENQTRIDSLIGPANYDIGHVFDGRAEQPGFFSFQGQATIGTVCRDGVKARGVSITRSLSPGNMIAYYSTSHEIGHQFSATHTFNANTGSCLGQRNPSTAYEPGTGSTIMGYRFACGSEDLMSMDNYFHIASLEQIVNYISNGSGSSCAGQVPLGNVPPQVYVGPNYTIPSGTPFALSAAVLDTPGDFHTYSWEQFDLGAPAPPDTDDGSRPIFRSFLPSTSVGTRTFPHMATILFGANAPFESLPVTTRTLNFRVTVRDNHFGGGGIGSAAMQVNVRSDSGPFAVTQPTNGATWPTGSPQTITWSVANTTNPPVSCSAVRILLSRDDGNTFLTVLVNNTPNDGSEVVTIPFPIPTGARIKIEAVNNIFFDISESFSVVGPSSGSPTIASLLPATGPVGSTVTITGTNFVDPSAVTFNSIPAVFSVNSSTEIVATVPPGATTGPVTVIISQTATGPANFTVTQPADSMQFSSATYSVDENVPSATIVVTRTGDTSSAASVDYATADGTAQQRHDYTASGGTLRFAAGETSKTFTVLISDDFKVEGSEQLNLSLSNAIGGTVGSPNSAILTISDNDTVAPVINPLDATPFFIQQHYYDFLNRAPDPGGLQFWVGEIDGACAPGDTVCLNHRRRDVSDAFFFEPEFQQTGGYVFRLYRAAYGDNQPFANPDPGNRPEALKLPSYSAFIADRAKVIAGGALADAQLAVANDLVRRPDFSHAIPPRWARSPLLMSC